MIRLDTRDAGFAAAFDRLLDQARDTTEDVGAVVATIIAAIRARRDAALIEATSRFDRLDLTPEGLRIDAAAVDAAVASVPAALLGALDVAATRITAFHEAQRPADLRVADPTGLTLGMRWTPLDAVDFRHPGAAPRRSRQWLSGPRPSWRWTASLDQAMPMWRRPSGRCSAASASTPSPAPRKW
jgi:histidinol dehydrogenase